MADINNLERFYGNHLVMVGEWLCTFRRSVPKTSLSNVWYFRDVDEPPPSHDWGCHRGLCDVSRVLRATLECFPEYCLKYFISIFCLSVLYAPCVEKPWSGEIRLEQLWF